MIQSSVSVVIFTKATSSWRGNIQFIKIHLDNFMITNETDLTTLKEAYALWGFCDNFSTLKDFLSVINDSCWIRRSAFRTLLILVMKYVNLVDHVIKSRSKPFRIYYLNSNLKPQATSHHLSSHHDASFDVHSSSQYLRTWLTSSILWGCKQNSSCCMKKRRGSTNIYHRIFNIL